MIDIPPQKPLREFSVLIIDGQTLVHNVLTNQLLEMGIRDVKCAENAYFALRLCEQTQFDIIMVAFDVKSDKDGFNLLEEMRFKGYITKTTSVVFLSADTSQELVNCVVELQPNDFWVKPLDRKKVEKRLRHIIEIKRKLYKLHYCIDIGEYPTAIYYAERQLQDPALAQYQPQINRLIGECLSLLQEYKDAEAFYRKLTNVYDYAWVQVGLARTLLKQDKEEEANALTEKLLEREDTRFTTYDVLAEYHIEKEDYATAYDIIQVATKLAPRNIERNKKSWNLARLNHDRKGQYVATQNMSKFAKNSIHDSPDLCLNVIRASIDLASTVSAGESNLLLTRAEREMSRLKMDYGNVSQLGDQLEIIQARILNVRQDKKQAEDIMKTHITAAPKASVEDNLDLVKAFHEVGFWEQSLALLDKIKDQVEGDSFIAQVIGEYIEQESQERKDIHYTPKELAEMANVHYKNKRYTPAFNLLTQALQLSPQNSNIAVSMMKVLAIMAEQSGLDDNQQEVADSCMKLLNSVLLTEAQQKKMDEYTARIGVGT